VGSRRRCVYERTATTTGTVSTSFQQYFTLFYYSLYFLTPSFFPFGALRTDGQISTPPVTKFFFFSTERAGGPYPQAQLYLLGWPNSGVNGRLNKYSTKKKVRRVLARKSLPRTNQNSPSAFSHQIRNNSKKDKTKTSQMMGCIENRPNKFLNQNFVRQGLPAKSKTRRFRFISLICVFTKKTCFSDKTKNT
jgi:hypothetical protein